MKIMKLKQINERLSKEIKLLNANLEKTIGKNRVKILESNPYTDTSLKAKEKELETLDKLVRSQQKEISNLRFELEGKTGYEK